jgi:hypothetical protein
MESATTEIGFRAFAFIIALAAVINGMGLTRLLAGFAEFLRRKRKLSIDHYGIFSAWALLQFLLHILLWWQLWEIQQATKLDFFTYLYLLIGPISLFLATSVLVPEMGDERIDLEVRYFDERPAYFTILGIFWIWACLGGIVVMGTFDRGDAVFAALTIGAVVLRVTARPGVHASLTAGTWLLIVYYTTKHAFVF